MSSGEVRRARSNLVLRVELGWRNRSATVVTLWCDRRHAEAQTPGLQAVGEVCLLRLIDGAFETGEAQETKGRERNKIPRVRIFPNPGLREENSLGGGVLISRRHQLLFRHYLGDQRRAFAQNWLACGIWTMLRMHLKLDSGELFLLR